MRRFAHLPLIAALPLHLALGSCDTWPLMDAMPADTAALAEPVPGLAFAPVLGAPVSASDRLTTAIATEAAERGVPLASVGPAAGFDYVLEGTASAVQTDEGTVIAFAWDLTDPNGIRQHRFVKTQTVPTRTADVAWGPAGAASLDEVAEDVAGELARWYGNNLALLPTAPANDDRITTAALTAPAGEAASAQADATPIALKGPPSIHLRDVAGEPQGSKVLRAAMRTALMARGAHLVPSPEPGTILVTGAMVVRPSSMGGDMVTLQWDVSEAGGGTLGTVMQERLFPTGTLDTGWTAAGNEAVTAAADGVLELVSPPGDSTAATAALKELRGFTQPGTY